MKLFDEYEEFVDVYESKPIKLSKTHLRILENLQQRGPMTIREIGDVNRLVPSTTYVALHYLRNAGKVRYASDLRASRNSPDMLISIIK
jgi:predicted transcriptional regulator